MLDGACTGRAKNNVVGHFKFPERLSHKTSSIDHRPFLPKFAPRLNLSMRRSTICPYIFVPEQLRDDACPKEIVVSFCCEVTGRPSALRLVNRLLGPSSCPVEITKSPLTTLQAPEYTDPPAYVHFLRQCITRHIFMSSQAAHIRRRCRTERIGRVIACGNLVNRCMIAFATCVEMWRIRAPRFKRVSNTKVYIY